MMFKFNKKKLLLIILFLPVIALIMGLIQLQIIKYRIPEEIQYLKASIINSNKKFVKGFYETATEDGKGNYIVILPPSVNSKGFLAFYKLTNNTKFKNPITYRSSKVTEYPNYPHNFINSDSPRIITQDEIRWLNLMNQIIKRKGFEISEKDYFKKFKDKKIKKILSRIVPKILWEHDYLQITEFYEQLYESLLTDSKKYRSLLMVINEENIIKCYIFSLKVKQELFSSTNAIFKYYAHDFSKNSILNGDDLLFYFFGYIFNQDLPNEKA
ncbi:hypothetical protein EDEG_03741 [Edhazardia aedis USNM 41457]|uniref:Uncharacterized protein n=1 Tax=Edhazardia aedis (strain USNM 41457) TaxID=1003232 RepID=J9D1L9_EDHAE|nr:hypothetical protein EDEG_03741 [Edhazardia aedis USNM 41457]|eukprot:EJW01736.1 hypothetical protein EDEG_03741 [Edhazardia aedis USNM 41457]